MLQSPPSFHLLCKQIPLAERCLSFDDHANEAGMHYRSPSGLSRSRQVWGWILTEARVLLCFTA